MAANLWELEWHSRESQVSSAQSRLPQRAGIKQTGAIALPAAVRQECCSLEPEISGTMSPEAGCCSSHIAHCCRAGRCSLVCKEAYFSWLSGGIYPQSACPGMICQPSPAHWFNTLKHIYWVLPMFWPWCEALEKCKWVRPSPRIQWAHSQAERLSSKQITLNHRSLHKVQRQHKIGSNSLPKGDGDVFFSFRTATTT